MRHKVAGWKLGRNTAHRRSLLRNLVTSLIVEERIETTIPKAKAMRPHVEKMITLGKRGDLAARRLAGSYLMKRVAETKKAMEEAEAQAQAQAQGAESAEKPEAPEKEEK
jgi:large subunit ribosomal protein L17